MSLARAFTTRRPKVFGGGGDSDGKVHRSHTVKGTISGPIRSKISGPVELIHTTNMLSYNAPDINREIREPKTATSTSSSSLRSEDESDHIPTAASSPPTSPDTSFPPTDSKSTSPEPNHLSCYFTPAGQSPTPSAQADGPAIPKRAPSHTKKSYDSLGRQHSISRTSEHSGRTISSKSSFSFSRSSSTSTSTSASSTHHSFGSHHHIPKISNPIPLQIPPLVPSNPIQPAPLATSHHKESPVQETNPFGHELAQVTELAEEYAAMPEKSSVVDQEERDLLDRGLKKFSPEDYIAEIQGLFASFFTDTHARNPAPVWI